MRNLLPGRRRWPWFAGLVGLAGVAVIAGSALLTGVAGAQTAPPDTDSQPVDAQDCTNLPPPPSPQQIADQQAQSAARLAQALGKTQADVEQALQQVMPTFKPGPGTGALQITGTAGGGAAGPLRITTGPAGGDASILDAAAAKLGVTPQELQDAMTATMPKPVCTNNTGAPGQTTVAVRFDPAEQAAAIAQKLGRGITAAQVQAALQLPEPGTVPPPPPGGPDKLKDGFEQQLATALGVTLDQLQAAMKTAFPNGQSPAFCASVPPPNPPTPPPGAPAPTAGMMCLGFGPPPGT